MINVGVMLRIGARVHLSPEGRNLHRDRRIKDRRGTIVGYSHDGTSYQIVWDGLKSSSVMSYHVKFIEGRGGTSCVR